MGVQLSLKAALPLAEILATESDCCSKTGPWTFNTLRLRGNGRHFPDDIFKWIFLNENVWISITISLKFVPRGPINNIPTLVQVMAWRWPGDKPLSEPMMARLPIHICYASLGPNELIKFKAVKWADAGLYCITPSRPTNSVEIRLIFRYIHLKKYSCSYIQWQFN